MRYEKTNWLTAAVIGLVSIVSGCSVESDDVAGTVEMSGSVGDGPVVNADILVYSRTGELLTSTVSGQDASYNVTVEASASDYPLTVEARGGVDLVTNLPPDFTLVSIATAPAGSSGDVVQATVNLSPFSSLIVATAERMAGGATPQNIDSALQTVLREFSSGLSSLAQTNPIAAEIDDSNLAEIVKASETLAETLRRVNGVMLAATGVSTIDDVIDAIGADLADGRFDGQGGADADSQISAATVLVASQVALESMTNTLRVNGQLATPALDAAINALADVPMDSPTASLPITQGMLDQAIAGVDAALALGASTQLAAVDAALGQLQAGMQPGQVAQILPVQSGPALDQAVIRISAGLPEDIDTINSGGAPGIPAPENPQNEPAPAPAPPPAPAPGPGPISGPAPNGWPSEIPAPWAGWDAKPASSNQLVVSGNGDQSFSCTGSPGNLAGLTAANVISGNSDDVIDITANYCVIHDITFEGWTVRVRGENYTIRDVVIDGAGRTGKNGLAVSGTNGVAYRNTVGYLAGNDRHCFTTGGGSSNIWIYDNIGSNCSGDGFQAGHQQEANRPSNVYLVRNEFFNNRENGLDYKFMQNVWAIENELWGHRSAPEGVAWCFPDRPSQCVSGATLNSGSDGSAVVIGSDGAPINVYQLRNNIHDNANAIRVEAVAGDIVIDANVMTNHSSRCLALDKDGMNLQFRANQCVNAERGIFQNWRQNFSLNVAGNLFENISGPAIEYEQSQVVAGSSLTNNYFVNTGPVIYGNSSASSAEQINALPRASGNKTQRDANTPQAFGPSPTLQQPAPAPLAPAPAPEAPAPAPEAPAPAPEAPAPAPEAPAPAPEAPAPAPEAPAPAPEAPTAAPVPAPAPADWPTEIPAPWAGWDAMPASSALITNNGGRDMTLTCSGTSGNLAGLTASSLITSGENAEIEIQANYCVVHNLRIEGYTVRVTGDHFVVRDVEIDGAGRTSKNGLGLAGRDGVAYRNSVHHLLGDDRHCYTNGGGSQDMWFIENEGYYCSGDGYQAGHQQQGNQPANIYLVRNVMHDNRENGLDYKWMTNVWAVENTLYNFASAAGSGAWCFPDDPTACTNVSSGSDGSAIVIGSDGFPTNVYHLRNVIINAAKAIRIEDADGEIVLEGNIQTGISGQCLGLDKQGMNVQYRGNECHDAGRGIFQNWRENFSLNVVGNLFKNIAGPAIEYEQGAVVDGSFLVDNTFINAGPVIYNNTTASTAAQINALPRASGNVVTSE